MLQTKYSEWTDVCDILENKILANQKYINLANQLSYTIINNNTSGISYTLDVKKISKEHEQKKTGSGGQLAQGKGRAIQI